MKKLLPLLLLSLLSLLSVLFLSACGSSGESKEQEARDVAEQYLEAQRSGDWVAFCGSLTERSQEALRLSVQQSGNSKKKPATCQEALENATKSNQEVLRAATDGVKIVSVTVGKNEATLVFEKDGQQNVKNMFYENGSWRMSVIEES